MQKPKVQNPTLRLRSGRLGRERCKRSDFLTGFILRQGWWMAVLWLAVIPLKILGAPQKEPVVHRTLEEGKLALSHGDYPHAIELFRQASAEEPDNIDPLLGIARAHLLSGKFQPALATYGSVLHRDPDNGAALTGLGETYNLLGRYSEAERPLNRVLSRSPASPDAAWALSRTYLYEGRLQHAERLLNRAVTQHPNDYRLWESMGEVQLEEGHRAEANTSLKKALALNPKARRSQLLLHQLEAEGTETPVKFELRDNVFWLSDGVGNEILTLPQTLSVNYGNHWHNQLTGDYRRLSFGNGSTGASAGESSEAGSGNTRTTGVFVLDDSARLRVNDYLTMHGGGGFARFGAGGTPRGLYAAGLELNPTSQLALSYDFSQNIVAPTELAGRLGITERGWSSHLHWLLPQSSELNLTYYQDRYSDSNHLRGGRGELRHDLWRRPFRITAGYQFESLSFARPALFHGYFSPKQYVSNSALLSFQGRKARFHYDYDFVFGQEAYTRPVISSQVPLAFVLQRRSNSRFVATLRNSYDLNQKWRFQFSALFYHSALSSTTGAYDAHAFLFGVTRRF